MTLSPTQQDWDALLDRIEDWIASEGNVRAAAIIGSRARMDRPADEWSDLDLILFVRDPSTFIDQDAWLEKIAPVWVTLDHDAPIPGVRVRQVLFEGGLDVDMIPLPAGSFAELAARPDVADVFGRAFRVLADKDRELAGTSVPDAPPTSAQPPSADRYLWTVSDFLFQAVWATKHLRRGELWLAKSDVDSYMKERLLEMIEWHAIATGRPVATWAGEQSGGRLLETWADPEILAALPKAFATYHAPDVGRALLSLMALFREVALQVAARLGLVYPDDRHDLIEGWVRRQA